MQPEILLEQIIGYSIGAHEIVPDIEKKADKDYNFAILPYGPHFYTGILQSAGYTLLSEKKNILFIITQDQQENEILEISWTFGPIVGKTWKLSTDKQRKSDFKPQVQDLEIILQHLPFLQIITQTQDISCLAIGNELSPQKKKKLTTYITDRQKDTNIIFLTNVSIHNEEKKAKTTKKSVIKNILLETEKGNNRLLTYFDSIIATHHKEAEIIAYANSSDFWGKKEKGIWYACILA